MREYIYFVCWIRLTLFFLFCCPSLSTAGGSRVGLPSGPNSRKSSILDLTQQQQQQLHQLQLQQLQLQQQQHLQQHLPAGIGNTETSPPSDDEDKRFRPRWKGSGTQLPPQSAKQALSRLKQAASVSNVAQQQQSQLLGSSLGDGGGGSSQQQTLRKGSMINLRGQDTLTTGQLQQRKSSMFQLASESPSQTHSQTLQRKGSVYMPAASSDTPPAMGTPTRKGSVYQRTSTDSGDSPQRKGSIYQRTSTDSGDSPQRKQSVVKTLSGSYVNVAAISGSESSYGLKLGPSQIHPKGYRLTTARHGELKMGFVKIKGNVEVEVSTGQIPETRTRDLVEPVVSRNAYSSLSMNMVVFVIWYNKWWRDLVITKNKEP